MTNTKSLVYRGEVKYTEIIPSTNLVEESSKFNLGLTENTFFQRHKLHKTSFNNPACDQISVCTNTKF